jgi:hypothetical protein
VSARWNRQTDVDGIIEKLAHHKVVLAGVALERSGWRHGYHMDERIDKYWYISP